MVVKPYKQTKYKKKTEFNNKHFFMLLHGDAIMKFACRKNLIVKNKRKSEISPLQTR